MGAYEKREGTYRQWARKKREEDPTWTLQKEQQKLRNQRKNGNNNNNNSNEYDIDDAIAAAKEKMLTTYASFECVRHVVSGSRCEVNPVGKRGVVCFVGKVKDTA